MYLISLFSTVEGCVALDDITFRVASHRNLRHHQIGLSEARGSTLVLEIARVTVSPNTVYA